LSGASAVSSAADVDVTSQQSTETPFSAESSRRRHHREQSSSDEASGLDDYVKTVNRKLRKLTSKIYMKDRIQQERDRSSSRETAHVHRRLNHMRSGIHNAQTSADHLQQSVSMLDSDLQDTRQRQIFQELLSSGIIKELVFHLKRELKRNHDTELEQRTQEQFGELWRDYAKEADHCSQEQLAARALLWDMLSHHEKRTASG
jgi:hypothetical protein